MFSACISTQQVTIRKKPDRKTDSYKKYDVGVGLQWHLEVLAIDLQETCDWRKQLELLQIAAGYQTVG